MSDFAGVGCIEEIGQSTAVEMIVVAAQYHSLDLEIGALTEGQKDAVLARLPRTGVVRMRDRDSCYAPDFANAGPGPE
jgi:hypothetical protein